MPGGFKSDMYNDSHMQDSQNKETDESAEVVPIDNSETTDNHQVDDDVNMTNWDKDDFITVTNNRKRFKVTINAIHVPGNSFPTKENNLLSVIGSWPGFLDCRRYNDYSNREVYFTAQFQTAEQAKDACTRQLFEGNDFKLTALKGRADETTKRRTMIIRDLPLDVNKQLLSTILENIFGKLETLKLRTAGPWYRADTIFESDELIQQKFENVWSIQYKKDLCRIAPATFSQEDVAARNAHVAKLTCLPFGTTAIDLKDVLDRVKGKTCFIPRTNSRYTRKRFAYISFESEDDLINVLSHSRVLNGDMELAWDTEDAKTCHKCGSSKHEIVKCPEKINAMEYRDRQRQFTGIYNRYHVQMPPSMKNYKPAANRSTLQANTKSTSQEDTLKPMLENLFKSFQSEIDKKFEEVSQQIDSLSNRIKIIEVNSGLSAKKPPVQPSTKTPKHKQPKTNLAYVPTMDELNKHNASLTQNDGSNSPITNKGKQPVKHNLSDTDNSSDPETARPPKKKVVVLDSSSNQETVKDSDIVLISKQQKLLESEMITMKDMIKNFTTQLQQIVKDMGKGSTPNAPNQ